MTQLAVTVFDFKVSGLSAPKFQRDPSELERRAKRPIDRAYLRRAG